MEWPTWTISWSSGVTPRHVRIASRAGKEVTECNLSACQDFTLSGSANTYRKTATVIQGGELKVIADFGDSWRRVA
jgi:hypothetical protein